MAVIPGDKSCSHRALILGALASGETSIAGLLESADVLATVEALRQFGIAISSDGGKWLVRGGQWKSPAAPIDCANSGTAARLLIGALAGMPGVGATITGDASLSLRPMGRVTAPLARMGATIEHGEQLPVSVQGARLGGIEHRNEPASAQVKSAILLAGLGTSAPVTVVEPVPSRDHSEIMLGEFGCDVLVEDGSEGRAVVLGRQRSLHGCALTIGADPSSAAFALAAAAIVPGSEVSVSGMLVNPLRTGFYETIESMGAAISVSNERMVSGELTADVAVRQVPLRPCHVPGERVASMIDEIPVLAMVAAFADGESVIEGLAELRVKESDRLGAIVAGLTACGVTALAEDDRLRIFGRGSVRGNGRVATGGDHRIAMAFLTLGLAAGGPVEVDGAGMIGTSFPGFAEVMQSVGARIA